MSRGPARPPVAALRGVRLADGGLQLFDGVDLGLEARTRACLVGRNGAGKSTLLRILDGQIEPDAGERFLQPGLKVAFVPQEPVVTGETLADYAASGGAAHYEAQAALTTFGLDPDGGTAGLSVSGIFLVAMMATLASFLEGGFACRCPLASVTLIGVALATACARPAPRDADDHGHLASDSIG